MLQIAPLTEEGCRKGLAFKGGVRKMRKKLIRAFWEVEVTNAEFRVGQARAWSVYGLYSSLYFN